MLDATTIATHTERIARDGYTIIENALDPALVDALVADTVRLERELNIRPARNPFEGTKTLRVYNLLVHGPLWEGVPLS